MKRTVLLLCRTIPHHSTGGMQIVAWDLARALQRQGIPVVILTTRINGHDGPFEDDGVTVVPIMAATPESYSMPWWSGSRRYVERHSDEIRAVISVSAAGFSVLGLKRYMPGTPFILQAHGTSWAEVASKWHTGSARSALASIRNLFWIPKDLAAYPRFDRVVAVNDRVHRDLLRPPPSWALPSKRVVLIHNGIDTSVFHRDPLARRRIRQELEINAQTRVIVSASRLHPQKGLDNNLRAFKRYAIRDPAAVYWIAGEGPHERELRRLTRELDLEDRVHFLGAVSPSRLAAVLSAADIFLFLTDTLEGLTLNVLEALATCLPVVVSSHVRIEDFPGLHRVHPRDYQSVAETLGEVARGLESERVASLPYRYTLEHASEAYRAIIESPTR